MLFSPSFRQFSALNFEKNCQTQVNLIRKEKHTNFAGAYDDLRTKQLHLQTIVFKIYF